MLKFLSYLNIVLALWYFTAYLLNSYSWPMAAIVLLMIYNGLVLRNLEQNSGFSVIHFVLGGFSVFFAGFLVLWIFNILSSAIEQQYFGGVYSYAALAGTFALSLILHFLLLLFSTRKV